MSESNESPYTHKAKGSDTPGAPREVPVSPEVASLPPTTLTLLYPYRGDALLEVAQSLDQSRTFQKEAVTALGARDRYVETAKKRLYSIDQLGVELSEHRQLLLSSIGTGIGYLLVHDELTDRGVSKTDIDKFFYHYFQTGLNHTAFSIKSAFPEINGVKQMRLPQISRSVVVEMRKQVNKAAGPAPSWFRGSQSAWESTFAYHAFSPRDLFSEYNQRLLNLDIGVSNETFTNLVPNVGSFFKEATPDWVKKGTTIDRDEVVGELREDIEEQAVISEQKHQQAEKYQYLIRRVEEKDVKMFKYLNGKIERSNDGINNFVDVIARISDESAYTNPEDIIEKVVSQYFSVKEPAFLALWLEKQLQTGHLIASVKDVASTDTQAALWQALEASKSDGSTIASLKETNKKTHNALAYEIMPLTSLLSVEELTYLQEVLSLGGSIEDTIWEASLLIGKTLGQREGEQLPKATGITLERYRKFRKKWLTDNWKWSFRELSNEAVIKNIPTVASADSSVLETPVSKRESGLTIEPEPSFITQTQTEERELKVGNLASWNLLYAMDRKIDPDHLSLLPGESLEEREQGLAQFLGENNISCSIKPGSVIRAMDWLVTVPESVENIRHKKQSGEEVFKKIKRGDVRILYKLDRDKKTISFFIHQKKAMNYGF